MFFPPLPANEERKLLVSQCYGDAETSPQQQTGALICPQPERKEQRQKLKWLPNELQEFSNVLMSPYDRTRIYCAFCSL